MPSVHEDKSQAANLDKEQKMVNGLSNGDMKAEEGNDAEKVTRSRQGKQVWLFIIQN